MKKHCKLPFLPHREGRAVSGGGKRENREEAAGTSALVAYRRLTVRRRWLTAALGGLTLLLAFFSLCVGASGTSPLDVLKALLGVGEEAIGFVLWNIRMPRMLAAAVAGAGLALAGCVMQAVLGNSMASPSTLGVSNAAVFGANFAIVVLGAGAFHSTHGETVSFSNPFLVTLCAFLSAVGAMCLVLLLTFWRNFSPGTVVLAGVALGSLFTAGTTVIQYFGMDTQVAAAVFWTFGDLGRASYPEMAVLAAALFLSGGYFIFHRWDYNALANGAETAAALGVRVRSVRFFSLLFSSIFCALCVSFLGIIGFLGLIAPHAVRRVTGDDHRHLLPAAALAGAALLLASDTAVRLLPLSLSLPVGAVTSLLGAPMFLVLILGKRRNGVCRKNLK